MEDQQTMELEQNQQDQGPQPGDYPDYDQYVNDRIRYQIHKERTAEGAARALVRQEVKAAVQESLTPPPRPEGPVFMQDEGIRKQVEHEVNRYDRALAIQTLGDSRFTASLRWKDHYFEKFSNNLIDQENMEPGEPGRVIVRERDDETGEILPLPNVRIYHLTPAEFDEFHRLKNYHYEGDPTERSYRALQAMGRRREDGHATIRDSGKLEKFREQAKREDSQAEFEKWRLASGARKW